MVWQERVPCIVMITNLIEGNKIKCVQYWPLSGSLAFGPFLVTIIDQLILADYTIRRFNVEVMPWFTCNLCYVSCDIGQILDDIIIPFYGALAQIVFKLLFRNKYWNCTLILKFFMYSYVHNFIVHMLHLSDVLSASGQNQFHYSIWYKYNYALILINNTNFQILKLYSKYLNWVHSVIW